MALKKSKYEVVEIDQEDILNFKELQIQMIKNKKTDIEGNVVKWLNIVWLQYTYYKRRHCTQLFQI